MDALSFIASLIRSLAWPCVAVFFLSYYAKPLKRVLKKLNRLRYKDFEVDFGKRLREVEAKAEKSLPSTEKAEAQFLPSGSSPKQLFTDIAKLDPSAAVLVSWRHLEQASRSAAERYEIRPAWQTLKVLQTLHIQGRIDDQTYQIFREMRVLRNQAAHEDAVNITEAQALEFGRLAIRLAAKLDEV